MATDALDIEVARRLYEAGWTQTEIARDFGVSQTTVRRWVLPGVREAELIVSRDWKARNKEHLKAYDRAYNHAHRHPCPQCGELMSQDATLCQACRHANNETRTSIIIGCHRDGWKVKEIAAVLGSTPQSLGVTLHRLRRAGLVGYRHRGYAENTKSNGTTPTLPRCSPPSSSSPSCSPSSSSTSPA